MKKLYVLLLSISLSVLCSSCEKLFNNDDPNELGGEQSPIGDVGAHASSSSMEIAGVSNFDATVMSLKDGVSSFDCSATVKNEWLKIMVADVPGITIEGDVVTATNREFKITKEGIECKSGTGAGILVRYDSKVGDTYPIGSTGRERKVVSKTDLNDYEYGFYLIKVIKVEEDLSYLKGISGITKVTYIANHKYGLVGVLFTFDDQSGAEFPIYSSGEN
jgi:hypothetical protein